MTDIAEIAKVVLTTTLIPPSVSAKWAFSNVYRLGFCWFTYDDVPGKLQYVNFAQQVFFPESNYANAFHFQLKAGCDGHAQKFTRPTPAAIKVANLLLSPVTGQFPSVQD